MFWLCCNCNNIYSRAFPSYSIERRIDCSLQKCTKMYKKIKCNTKNVVVVLSQWGHNSQYVTKFSFLFCIPFYKANKKNTKHLIAHFKAKALT